MAKRVALRPEWIGSPSKMHQCNFARVHGLGIGAWDLIDATNVDEAFSSLTALIQVAVRDYKASQERPCQKT